MRKASEELLGKFTCKLYAADIDYLRNAYGWGYSVVVRDLVRAHITRIRVSEQEIVNMNAITEMTDE